MNSSIANRCRVLKNRFYNNSWEKSVDHSLNDNLFMAYKNSDAIHTQVYLDSDDVRLAIATEVKREGYIVLPNVFSGEILNKFQSEFRELIDTADKSRYTVDRKDTTICVRVEPRESLDIKKYPVTAAFFGAKALNDISGYFYNESENGYYLNNEIFVHETPETDAPLSGAMHWDRAQTLKFWIYIDDLPEEAGPMRLEKGAVEKNRAIRINKHSAMTKLTGGVDNVVEVDDRNVVPLTGLAGSIMIHDTDASHGASQVKHGYVRRIMRGHSRAK